MFSKYWSLLMCMNSTMSELDKDLKGTHIGKARRLKVEAKEAHLEEQL